MNNYLTAFDRFINFNRSLNSLNKSVILYDDVLLLLIIDSIKLTILLIFYIF